ncbi:33122_t:CDS:2 [Gigaspora margarita]|uniref:33122_t:CDS:1 n=1 Tax=Gigaspora margarita TaxID=4874 RepID=A0ABN7W6I9_GIGMA|nr:33122_t:CDS:2 [Gigaspora margarita]
MEKGKQVIFKKNFPGPMNYELESLFSSVLGSEFGTVFGANSFKFPSGSVTLNFTMPGSVNSELYGSVDVELPPAHVELPPGSVNPEYTSIFPGCVNSELYGFVDVELSPDLVPGSVNSKLCGSVDVKSSPCLVNPEHNSTLSSSLDFELTKMDNNLSGLVSSRPISNESSGLNSSVIANINQMIQYDTTELKLQVGDPFNDWDTVQCVVDAYSKQHSFVAIKCHKDLDPVNKSIIQRCDYACWKSGVNRPKKVEDIDVHRDGVSGKTNCPWLVRFYFGKCVKVINITSIVDKHNHICDPNTIELAPKHLQFLPSILDRIENYTIVGQLSAGVRIHDKSDTAMMLQHLLNLKEQDQKYIVIPHIEGKSNELTGLFWMNFYHMRNSCTQDLFELKCQHMLTKYEPCRSYLETKLYPYREAWARYTVLKVFTAGAELTQRVESINGVLKKHVNRGTLLKELVQVVKQELEKEASYNRIRDYYRSNSSSGLPSTYNTIFKAIDLVLAEYLTPIPLLLQQAQMNQSLLYQEILTTIEQATDCAIEHLYDVPQIQLKELLSGISNNEVEEIWEVFYVGVTSTSKSHYVVIFKDSTLLCICMQIINLGMQCRHQYQIFIQSPNAIFYLGLIHTRWFRSIPSEIEYVTISQGIKIYTSTPLYHIHQIRTANVYTPTIKECIDKKVQFGTIISLAKTSVQIAVEGIVAELVRGLTQFITKYHRNTGLGIQETCSIQNEDMQTNASTSEIVSNNRQLLINSGSHCNIIEVSNPEYHKPRGRPPKQLKLYIEEDKENAKQHSNREQRTCSYCSGKGYNIHGCAQYKANTANKENY